ncbi:hypothetical protein [Marinicrinis sediminis]|uniref:Uncharacterized protein n=1 Tax=Marinicrinis sediminis TaxID=1652465 RepID=A0ABW5R9R7_9BACL
MKKLFLIESLVLVMLLSSCSNNICSNEIRYSLDSPNGEYTAYTFTRNCGSTTKKGYHLTILDEGEHLKNKSGNIFVTYHKFEFAWVNEKEESVN